MDTKEILGGLAVLVGVIGYVQYILGIIRGNIKPHVFSWLMWLILTVIAFAAQWFNQAGPGLWNTGVTILGQIIIVVLALFAGAKYIRTIDWFFLTASIAAVIPWLLTNDPLLSVILICVIDVLSFGPTIRKGYEKPYEESTFLFTLAGIKFLLSIFALTTFPVVNWLYPLVVVVMNFSLVSLLVVRRKQLVK